MTSTPDICHIDDIEILRELQLKITERISELQEQAGPALRNRWEEEARRLGLGLRDIIHGPTKRKGRVNAHRDE